MLLYRAVAVYWPSVAVYRPIDELLKPLGRALLFPLAHWEKGAHLPQNKGD